MVSKLNLRITAFVIKKTKLGVTYLSFVIRMDCFLQQMYKRLKFSCVLEYDYTVYIFSHSVLVGTVLQIKLKMGPLFQEILKHNARYYKNVL